MSEMIKPVVEATGIMDVVLLGLGVKLFDLVAAPMVGDNNIMSGIVKGGLGMAVYHMGGSSMMKIAGGAGVVAGISDVIDATVWPVIATSLGGTQAPGEAW